MNKVNYCFSQIINTFNPIPAEVRSSLISAIKSKLENNLDSQGIDIFALSIKESEMDLTNDRICLNELIGSTQLSTQQLEYTKVLISKVICDFSNANGLLMHIDKSSYESL